MRGVLPAIGLAFLAGPAFAHAFDAGADAYGQFVEGASVMLTYPGILLPLLALGVFLSLWQRDGLPRVWAVFLAGQVAGVFAAVLAGPAIAVAFMALGLATAAVAALAGRIPDMLAFGLAGATGLGALMAGLEGHGLFELPAFTHLGLLFGANLATAMAAGLAQLVLDRVPADWMRIGWRVVASWIGAMLLLISAFEVAGGIS